MAFQKRKLCAQMTHKSFDFNLVLLISIYSTKSFRADIEIRVENIYVP